MFILTIEEHFSSAHQLRGYRGKCENLHGHNWKVVLSEKCTRLNEIGLLVDFSDIKNALKKIVGGLDHTNINEISYFTAFNPSSEHIAQYIAEKFTEEIKTGYLGPIALDSVTVWESETSRCTYIP
jgi:6-pyruvoyltetrahydropterin/6-carboxytetrahydropterin synthase